MRVAIGNDHRGVDAKKILQRKLESWGYEVKNCGSDSTESCDYPDIAAQVAAQVATSATEFGILICGTGIGMAMAANKVPGIRAAVCNDTKSAQMSRQHNNANVLCLSGDILAEKPLDEVVSSFLESEFEGGRHQLRVDKIASLETCRAT